MDVGGGAEREGVASAQPAGSDRPSDDRLLSALGAERVERRTIREGVERAALTFADGRATVAVLKFGGFHRSSTERRLYEEVLQPGIHGSPALLAAGEGWLLLEDLSGGRAVDLDDADAVRAVFRRLADVHASARPVDGLAASPLGAPDLGPLVQLVDRAARDHQAWEITPSVRSLVDSLAAWAGPALAELQATGPDTLLHGDYQRGNWLIDAAGAARVLDWELAAVGPGILDLYYLQPRGAGAGHAPAGPMTERAVAWYCERLAELADSAPEPAALLARLPDAIAWGALAAARLRLEDYYAEASRSRSPRGELPRAAADLIRHAAAQVGCDR